MKIVLFGAGGQLGRTFLDVTKKQQIEVVAYTRNEADITDKKAISIVLQRERPDYVLNAAAYTAVDKAEAEQELASLINETGAENIALACKEINSTLIHISTDYVFNGEKNGAYIETDKPRPINTYGLSKYKGEEAVCQVLDRYIILRVSWVFSPYGNNFVKTMLKLAQQHEKLNVVEDQVGSPTATENIANVILKIIKYLETENGKPYGLYHYCDAPFTNWYTFAEKIFSEAKQYKALKISRLNAIKAIEYPTPSKRPINSQLDCQLLKTTFGIDQYSWEDSLAKLIKKLMSQ